ncbi:MAG TPA: ATP-binding protein [Gemmatimonadaceae bacterium]|nr:ATP-binding protein [Gemmatimonadaceae bacterium]
MFEPRRVLRWIYIGRVSLAFAVFLAAVFAWQAADARDTLVVSLVMVATTAFTALSAWYHATRPGVLPRGFYYLQATFDVLLVTAVVHVTGGALSQFAALYILVTVGASLLLPMGGALLVAALGNACYFVDVLLVHDTDVGLGVFLQLVVFAAVALGIAYLSARLQEAGVSREALEAQLVLAKLQAEDVLRNIRSGIITIDARGRLIFLNPAARALLGLPDDIALGRTVDELIVPRAPELAAALERAVQRRERTTRGEAVITGDGRAFPIGFTTTTMDADGTADVLSATVIFQDISGNKQVEELRLRAERLEAVAELSASLAHEIKNPLASIRSAVEQLARAPRATDDERTLGRLIVRESDRLSRLLSEFLDFARVSVTRGMLVDLGAITRAAASLVATHPDCARGISVACDVPRLPLLVEGDEDLLHRAVFNIVLNAVQASPDGGRVVVELAPLARDLLPLGTPFREDAAALRVTDDGPGIPTDIRDRVFDPFFTTKPGGTGLGLPIVHRAIEAHRGLVMLESGAQGTKFTVLLPQSRPAGAEAA